MALNLMHRFNVLKQTNHIGEELMQERVDSDGLINEATFWAIDALSNMFERTQIDALEASDEENHINVVGMCNGPMADVMGMHFMHIIIFAPNLVVRAHAAPCMRVKLNDDVDVWRDAQQTKGLRSPSNPIKETA